MKTNELLDLIMLKFKESNGYSEMGDDKLKKSIKDCLDVKYRKEMDDALNRLNRKQKHGRKISDHDYEIEQMSVEENVIYAAQLLAATTKEDLQNLI